MAEKKVQEVQLPEEQPPETSDKLATMSINAYKTSVPLPITPATLVTPKFTKTVPNDLYRRLLPAVLFVLTFVTVMTMLLIYMDTVALGAQQFRLNMSRDYELERIGQDSAALVQYVRQVHLAPRPLRPANAPPRPTLQLQELDRLLGELYNGTFVEFLPSGPRDPTTWYLEAERGWDGVVARARPRDYLALRGAARALQACLSASEHPREVTFVESGEQEAVFRSRVLCLPLYTVLLAAEAGAAPYALLGGRSALAALTHLPFDRVRLQVIEVRCAEYLMCAETTQFLLTKNYTVARELPTGVMYSLAENRV